jgi:hypothetical protein
VIKLRAGKLLKYFSSECGATLVEELVTVGVISFGIVILVVMITTGVIGVRLADDKVVSESLARSQMELIKDAPFEDDPVSNPYPSVTAVPGYVVSVGIEYWDAVSSAFTTTPMTDGLQKIIVTVTANGDTLNQTGMYKVDR